MFHPCIEFMCVNFMLVQWTARVSLVSHRKALTYDAYAPPHAACLGFKFWGRGPSSRVRVLGK